MIRLAVVALVVALASGACARSGGDAGTVITFSGSAVGAEGEMLTRQLARFARLHPEIAVRVQRSPDDATQRHQLYVQWLNARAGDPDILQLDVVWTSEFAAAGWILPLTRFGVETGAFFPATIAANVWRDTLYAIPWFADVGLLYWRTDLMPAAPASMDELVARARAASGSAGLPSAGIVWQGARYEGLVTVFLEYLGAFGGSILDAGGRVTVADAPAVRALEAMRDQLYEWRIAPLDVLTWHEEETRFAFQNGNAALMRNWPYAAALLSDSAQSRVAGRFAVATMPAAPGGAPTATLGGAQLAINAHSEHPEAAFAVIEYLTAPEQMLERVEAVGQYPTRPALFDDPRLRAALPVPASVARAAVVHARPRPVTPIYTELSEILQIALHRALVRQAEPRDALAAAARQMEALIERTGVRELMARSR